MSPFYYLKMKFTIVFDSIYLNIVLVAIILEITMSYRAKDVSLYCCYRHLLSSVRRHTYDGILLVILAIDGHGFRSKQE